MAAEEGRGRAGFLERRPNQRIIGQFSHMVRVIGSIMEVLELLTAKHHGTWRFHF